MTYDPTFRGLRILDDILRERGRQARKWGEQNHSFGDWLAILMEEIGEASREQMEIHYREATRGAEFREELVQCAAVLHAMIDCGDRNGWFTS